MIEDERRLTNRQAELASVAHKELGKYRRSSVASFRAYLAAGDALAEARDGAKRGQWAAVLEAAGVESRTARNMMTLARSGIKPETVSSLGGIQEALQSLKRGVRDRKREEHFAALEAGALPNGKFGVVYADPPWPYTRTGYTKSGGGVSMHYPTMSLEEIAAMPVAAIAADDCILYMWTVAPFLKSAFPIMEAWGFQYSTNMVWVKRRMGQGFRVRGQHEILLLGVRGKFPQPAPEDVPPSLYMDPPGLPRRRHSEKPDYYYSLFESLYPGIAKVELFARQSREGWTSWGNEISDAAAA